MLFSIVVALGGMGSDASAQDLGRELLEIPVAVKCTPNDRPSNSVLRAWAAGSQFFTAIKTLQIPAQKTNNCLPSNLVQLTPDVVKTLPDMARYLAVMTLNGVQKRGLTPKQCGNDTLCCANTDGSSVDCVLRSGFNPASSNGEKLDILQAIMWSIGYEIGANSFTLDQSNSAAWVFPGDTLVFVWPYILNENGRKSYLLTPLNGDLSNRLAAFMARSMPALRAIQNKAFPGSDGFLCSADGIQSRPTPKDVNDALVISYGAPGAPLRKPLGVSGRLSYYDCRHTR
jgi:hypothetical protein